MAAAYGRPNGTEEVPVDELPAADLFSLVIEDLECEPFAVVEHIAHGGRPGIGVLVVRVGDHAPYRRDP